MLVPHLRAAGLALAIAIGLAALTACDKKKSGDNIESSPPPYPGSKTGPPGGLQESVEPGMPSPPGRGPHLVSADGRSRSASVNNLRQIGLGFHNYFSSHNSFPNDIADAQGKPGLSWRVALLPYIDQDLLYRQFKLDEPWNSDHNKKLIAQMPTTYALPGVTMNGYTYYRSFTGTGTVMPPPVGKGTPGQAFRGVSLAAIPDGTSNTLLAAEAFDPVIWTKPGDLPFSPGKPPKLGGAVFADGFTAAFCDGSVKFLRSSSIDTKTLSNLIQTNDGQLVNID